MADAVTAGAAPLLPGLPDEIVVWEILVRLPPKSLLRCRAVCRAWRRTTSTRDFLLAHHGRQPSLPVVCGYVKAGRTHNILALDHRSADDQLQPVARLDNDKFFCLEASYGGLLILSIHSSTSLGFSVCNLATRQHAPLRHPSESDFSLFKLLGMYLHRPSGEYRLLMYRMSNSVLMSGHLLPEGQIGCYVFTVGSDLPPRYVGGPEAVSALRFDIPALVRDSLHWSPVQHQNESRLVTVFDTTTESFRHMRAPAAPTNSSIFEMDGTLGIYSYNAAMKVVDIWVLQNYEGEVWEHKYRVGLPVTEIRGQLGRREGSWYVTVVSADGDILLLLCHGEWLFYVGIDGKLVDSFHRDGQQLSPSGLRLKQTLVPHTFFTPLEDYAVNTSPFI